MYEEGGLVTRPFHCCNMLNWVVLTRALTRNAILNTVSANESLVSGLVSEASVSDVLLTNERCH